MTNFARAAKFVGVLTVLGGLSACATMEDNDALTMKIHELEEKVNTALQNSAAAKVDASTAMFLLEKKK